MRRPPPLPPGEPARHAAADRSRARVDLGAQAHDRDDDAAAADADETAPIVPLRERRPVDARPDGPSVADTESAEPVGEGETGEGAGTPAPGGVRTRDVWRAARARRRALRQEVRRFTGPRRRRRWIWVGTLAALVLLVVGTIGAAYSPLFAVERVRVLGAEGVDTAEVEQSLAGQIGTPLPLVDASTVESALLAFPLIESYSLEARPPHELVVRIVERSPIGVVEAEVGYSLVDAAGVVLEATDDVPAGMPVIEVAGGLGSPAFAAAGAVLHALPEALRSQVTHVAASSRDDVALTLGDDDARVIWGSSADSAMKAQVLEMLMTNVPPTEVSVYDVSSPETAVVR